MRRKGFTLVEFVVVVAIIGILAAILLPVFQRSHPPGTGSRDKCRSNLKRIGLGFLQYAQDYNKKFPPVAVSRSGYWAGSLQPYMKDWRAFQCPSAGANYNVKITRPRTTDYFFNSRLAAVAVTKIPAPSQTILAGDGRDNSPTNYALSALPDAWRHIEKSPATRHLDGADYAFADGHVKWLQPEKITAQSPAKDVFTFAIR